MVGNKRFSVIIPVYNCESCLRRSIESVLKQTYPLVEIIIIDDGSNDNSSRICDEYAEKYDNCKVIHQENKGVASARNRGLVQATGEYICFLDADDYYEKNLLTRVASELEKGVDICSFGARRVDEEERYLYEIRFDSGIGNYDFSKIDRQQFILNTFFQYQVGWEVWLQAYKKSFLVENHVCFNEQIRYGEDKVFSMECMSLARRIVKIPDVLYNYTQRKFSATSEYKQGELINQGNLEFLSIEQIWRNNGTIDSGNDYLFYIGLMSFYYFILLKTLSIEELKLCFDSADQFSLQKNYLKRAVRNKRVLQHAFGKKKSSEILKLVVELVRD